MSNNIIITLTNVIKISPNLTLHQCIMKLESFLKTYSPDCGVSKIIGVQEFHENGEIHYHIILIITKGLRKNTFRKILRALFIEFSGRTFDAQSIKSLKSSFNYIFKDRKTPDLVKAISGDYSPGTIYSTIDLRKFLAKSRLKVEPYLENAYIVSVILKYKTYDKFLITEGKLGITACSQSLKYNQL